MLEWRPQCNPIWGWWSWLEPSMWLLQSHSVTSCCFTKESETKEEWVQKESLQMQLCSQCTDWIPNDSWDQATPLFECGIQLSRVSWQESFPAWFFLLLPQCFSQRRQHFVSCMITPNWLRESNVFVPSHQMGQTHQTLMQKLTCANKLDLRLSQHSLGNERACSFRKESGRRGSTSERLLSFWWNCSVKSVFTFNKQASVHNATMALAREKLWQLVSGAPVEQ